MTISSIIVRFPFPLSPIKWSEITVTFEMKIIDVIKICLQKQGRPEINPHEYSIVINPLSFALLPFLSIGDYKNAFFSIDDCAFSLVPKMLFSFRINILTLQIASYADKNQTIEALIYQIRIASSLLCKQQIQTQTKVNAAISGDVLPETTQSTPNNDTSPNFMNKFLKNLNFTPKLKLKLKTPDVEPPNPYHSLVPKEELDPNPKCNSPIDLDYINNLSELNVYFNGQEYPLNTSLNDLIIQNHYQTVILNVKREKKATVGNWSTNDVVPLFKGTLQDALRRNKDNSPLPFFVSKLFELIESHKNVVGIYRKSGDQGIINQIASKIDTTLDTNELSNFLLEQNPHELVGVFKLYIRQLSEPVVPDYLSSIFRSIVEDGNDITITPTKSDMDQLSNLVPNYSPQEPKTRGSSNHSHISNLLPSPEVSQSKKTVTPLIQLYSLLRCLPKANFLFLRALCQHLEIIESASATNQMNYKNLAICISTSIIRVSQGLSSIKETQDSQTVCQMIFENWKSLFDGPSPIETVRVSPPSTADLLLPEPCKAIKLNIMPNISGLSSRTYFRPDHKIIEMQSTNSVAAQVSRKLKDIEDQIIEETQHASTITAPQQGQAKLRFLIRQLDSL